MFGLDYSLKKLSIYRYRPAQELVRWFVSEAERVAGVEGVVGFGNTEL